MSPQTSPRTFAVLAGTFAVLTLAGCTGGQDAAPSASQPTSTSATPSAPTPSPSAPSPSSDVALSIVRDYLAAIQAESYDEAYALLTDESATLAGSAEQFAEASSSGLVRPDEAAGFLGEEGALSVGAGPAPDTVLVTAVRDRVADAWLVRSADGSVGIDDAGVPPTGASPYEWINPASGAEDVGDVVPIDRTAPAAILFRIPDEADGPGLVGSPEQLTAYAGTVEVPVSPAASENERRWDIALDSAPPSSETEALTVVWEVAPGSGQWRTSTTPVFLDPAS